ncbi:MAG: cbb3-type cytochrome oxidase assembly protein CcoS [Wenzhouxiangellaceae bacterium]|nr:cbb3-type cytochrome oxidase assembly protein CcoS [Wenzhouxiangellaceae bacterium]
MTIIYVLIPLSLVLLSIAIWAFFWAVRNDQFDDLDTPALDVLDDDEPTEEDRPDAADSTER